MSMFTKFVSKYFSRSLEFDLLIEVKEVLRWNQFLDIEVEFLEKYAEVFQDAVYQSHKYLIKVTPYDTGRLRYGWTSYLDKNSVDYSSAIQDTSLVGHAAPHPDSSAQADGKGLSSYQEKGLSVSLTNNVPYGEFLELGTSRTSARHFTSKARYKAEWIFNQAVELWAAQCKIAGHIVKPTPMPEVS